MFSKTKLFGKNIMRTKGFAYIFTALLTAIASELKVVPFNGEDFRFGLGSMTFFLLVLIWSELSIIRTGIVTGITVVCFRLIEDVLFDEVLVLTSLEGHFPAFFFYFLFALGLHTIRIEKYKTSPLILGTWAALFELIGNGTEHILRNGVLHQSNLDIREWLLLSGVALLRSFFVVGLYSSITVSEQKKRIQEMLGVGSELYAETLYLQKSMNHIEQITAESFDLYRKLKKKDLHPLSVQALQIAQEIHEVKKDSQRILAGLTKITEREDTDSLYLSDVLNLVQVANEKYSEWLKKNIIFRLNISVDFETNQQIPLLSLLNNLCANAVEAIADKGEICLDITEKSTYICFHIKDSGKGIAKEDIPVIFEPGFTTKFNDRGVGATGIGLSHVQAVVQALEGKIEIESNEKGTAFQIYIPVKKIGK